MQFSDEQLIAYLLGELDYSEESSIEESLKSDDKLRERLSTLRLTLGQLDSLGGCYEPPATLFDDTMQRIDASCSPALSDSAVAASASPVSWRERRLTDSLALVACVVVLCSLLLPTVVKARHESRKAQCSSNLAETGFELVDFAMARPDQRFPLVDEDGPLGFAGIYSLQLKETGRLRRTSQLLCAGRVGDCELAECGKMPRLVELLVIPEEELIYWQKHLGGDYAYNLGVIENGRSVAPQLQGRTSFAILGDAPEIFSGADSSQAERLVAHDGFGINVFYEDGHVSFISAKALLKEEGLSDHPLRNHQGVHEVGIEPRDSSLAPSHWSPLGDKPDSASE